MYNFFILFPLTVIFLIYITVGYEVIKTKNNNIEIIEKFEDNSFVTKCILFLYFTYIILFLPTVISILYSQNYIFNTVLISYELFSSGIILFYIMNKVDNTKHDK